MSPRTGSWCDLPPELLVSIADNHCTPLDVLRLRSTCRSWRDAISSYRPGKSSIWSSFPSYRPKVTGGYKLIESNVYYLKFDGSNLESKGRNGWLVKIEESGTGRQRALDPLSRVRLGGIPKLLNLLDWRVFEIAARSYSLTRLDNTVNMSIDDGRCLIPKKLVMSSVDGNVREGDLLMGIFDRNILCHCEVWGPQLELEVVGIYSDVVFRKARFYAVNGVGSLMIIDRSLNTEIIPWSGPQLFRCEHKYLVDGRGSLYLVVNKNILPKDVFSEDSTVGRVTSEDEVSRVWFEVFCFKEEQKEWVQVYCLGELAFFISDDCSFSVIAGDYPPYQRNCIYYSDYNSGDSTLESFHHVFDLEKSYFRQKLDCGCSSTIPVHPA